MPTATHTDPRPDVNEMVVIHRVFRREFAAVPQLVRRTREGDTARARVVADHLRLIMSGLHMHHTGEDVVLWPLLLERAAPSTALVETMQRQHHRVDEYAAQVEPLAAAWTVGRLGGPGRAARARASSSSPRHSSSTSTSRSARSCRWSRGTSRYRSGTASASTARTRCPSRQLPLMFGAILEEADAGRSGGGCWPTSRARSGWSCAPSARGSTAATSRACEARELVCQLGDLVVRRSATCVPGAPEAAVVELAARGVPRSRSASGGRGGNFASTA